MKFTISKEEKEINIEVSGPLAEQISSVLQQEYKTKTEEELNNATDIQALATSLESAAIDTTLLNALSNGMLSSGNKQKYTTIYGITKSNFKNNNVVNINDSLVAHMKDPRCDKYCVYVHGDRTGNIIEQQKLDAFTLTLECYQNAKVFHDFGKMIKYITNGS